MAQDISTLVVKVTSDGITKTANALDKLTASADKAESSVKRLGTAWAQAQASLNTGTGNAAALTGAIAALSNAIDRMSNVSTRAAGATRQHNVAMQEAQGLARGLSGSLGALWVTYSNLAGTAVGLGIGAALKGVVSTGAQVEQTLETIRVLGESSTKEVAKLKDELLLVGQGAQGPKEVAEAFQVLTLAGLNAKDALKGAGAALNLSTAGGIGIEKSASTLVQVSTALGFTADGFNRIGDVIAKTAAVSMSSVDSISGAFKSAASVGELYGATLTDIGVGLAAVANLGIQGTAAGTALKNTYKDLASGSEKVTNTLAAMGLKLSDLKGKDGYFLPIVEVVNKLSAGLDKVNDRQTALGNLFGERGIKPIAALLKLQQTAAEDSDKFANKLEELRDRIDKSYGFAAQAAIALSQTSNNQFKSIGNTIQTSLIKAFDELSPKVGDISRGLKAAFSSPEFINGLKSIVTVLGDLVLWISKNVDTLKVFVAGFAAFKALQIGASLTAIATGLSSTAIASQSAATGLTGASIAARGFQAALGPIGLTITALTTLWVLYKAKKDAALDISGVNDLKEAAKRLEEYNARLERNHNLRLKGTSEEQIAAEASAQAQVTAFDKVVEASAANVAKLKADLKAREADMGSFELAAIKRAQRNGTTGGGIAGGIAKEYFDQVKAVNKAEKDHLETVKQLNKAREESFGLAKRDAEEVEAAAAKARQRAQGETSLEGASPIKGQSMALNTEITSIRTGLSEITNAYKQYLDDSKTLAATGESDARVELEKRKAATQDYLKDVQTSYEKELAVAAKYRGKDREDTLKHQNAMIEASKAYRTSVQNTTMLALNKDENSVAKKEEAAQDALLKSIEKSGEAESKRLVNELNGLKAREEGINQLKSVQSDFQASQAFEEARQQDLRNQELEDIAALGDSQREAAEAELRQGQRRLLLLKAIGNEYGNIAKRQRAQEAQDRTTKNIDEALAATKRFSKGLEEAFGASGKALGGIAESFAQFAKDRDTAQVNFNKASEEDKANGKAIGEQNRANAEAQISAYAGIAQSAQGFFREGTRGYAALGAASKVFHIAEAAMQAARIVQLGIAAILNQGNGDPYTAFARIAAMTAIVAGLGVAVSGGGGGGGGKSAAEVQKSQGTGSVLGDATAKSESIAKSLEAIKNIDDLTLPLTIQMANSLKNIENAIAGVASFVARTPGLQQGTNLGIKEGTIGRTGLGTIGSTLAGTNTTGGSIGGAAAGFLLGGPIGAIAGTLVGGVLGNIAGKIVSLFGKTTQTIVDSGIQFAGQVKDLQKGLGFEQYASVNTTKSSFFGFSKSTSNKVVTQGLSEELSTQFGLVFQGLEKTLTTAAPILGKNADAIAKVIDNFAFETTKISLKDLKGDELTKAISNVISKALDDISQAAFPELNAFRQVGEGYAETVVRVATGIEKANTALKEFNITAISYADIIDKQADVAYSILQQSIAIKEAGTGVGEIIKMITTSADDVISAYRELVSLRNEMKNAGLGTGLNLDTITGAGGIDKLSQALADYTDKYLTTAEKIAGQTTNVTAAFAAIGKTLPQSEAELRSWIEAAAKIGDQKQLGQLLSLAGAFDKLIVSIQSGLKEAIDSAKDALDKQYDEDSAALKKAHEARIAAIKDNTEKEIGAQIKADQAKNALDIAANQAAIDAVNDRISALESLQNSLKTSIQATTQYDQATARANALNLVNKATQSKDITSILGLDDAIKELAKPSENLYSTLADYNKAQAVANNALQSLDKATGAQLTDAQKQLVVLNAQKDALDEIKTSLGTKLADTIQDRLDKEDLRYNAEQTALDNRHNEQIKALDDGLALANQQLNSLIAIQGSTKATQEAIAALVTSISALAAQNAAISGAIGGATTAQNPPPSGNVSNADFVGSLYETTLGRKGEDAGLAFWQKALENGASREDVTASFLNSDEYKALHANNAPKASFAVGTNYVPEDMVANIHEGERIIPAADNAELMRRMSSNEKQESNDSMMAKMDQLIDVIMRGDVAKVQKSNDIYRIVRDWDGNGLPPTRPST